MIERLPVVPVSRQHGLWETECLSCGAYRIGACRGHETAPCRCVWTSADRRYRCDRCPLVCRERRTEAAGLHADTFSGHLAAGADLAEIRVFQPSAFRSFPPFIPLRTHELPAKQIATGFQWVGVDLKTLLSPRYRRAATLRQPFRTGDEIRSFLRVGRETNLLTVLNGDDRLLEGFWAMKRPELLRHLRETGFAACTGPTFSVYEEIDEVQEFNRDGTVARRYRHVPAAHTAVMLRRHHRVIREAAGVSLLPIPNIYWLTPKDRANWTSWLRENPRVHCVSRDFSRTRSESQDFSTRLAGLVEIVKSVGRPLHVLLVNVSLGKMESALRYLCDAGCTASIVTGDPIAQAIMGGKGMTGLQDEKVGFVRDEANTRADLATSNLATFSDYVNDFVQTLYG